LRKDVITKAISDGPCGLPGIRTNQRDGENIFLGSCPLSGHFNDALGVLVIVAFGRSCAFRAAVNVNAA
jgi:hypothetical protein